MFRIGLLFLLSALGGVQICEAQEDQYYQIAPEIDLSLKPRRLPARHTVTRWEAFNNVEFLRDIKKLRNANQEHKTTAEKSAETNIDLGDTLVFNTTGAFNRWTPRPFILASSGDGYRLWIDIEEWDDGRIVEADIFDLDEALGFRTPSGSVNPEAGILENNRLVFGEELNFDGDGILDLLWYDIPDDFPSKPPLLGFIAPEDYRQTPVPGEGNQADILYLDTDPLLIGDNFGISNVKEIVAGTHQMLIQINEDADESPFVVIGLSEWAKVLNGYPGRGAEYLGFTAEHNIPLLTWEGLEGDFQRAGLFTTYLAQRLGVEAMNALTSESSDGAEGYEAIVAAYGGGLSLEEVIFDFHTANFVNDPSDDMRFGYDNILLSDVGAVSSTKTDASLSTSTANSTIKLESGGVQYLTWENIADVQLTLNVLRSQYSQNVRVRLVQERINGVRFVIDIDISNEAQLFPGAFRTLTIVVTHIDLHSPATDIWYRVGWEGTAVITENISYDDGFVSDAGPNFVRLNKGWIQASRFIKPDGTDLNKVFLAPYYHNQFIDSQGNPVGTPGDPRDLILHIWNDSGQDYPGEQLFSLSVQDPRRFRYVNSYTLDYFEVDLTDYSEMTSLPDTIYIGLSDEGEDDNDLLLVVSNYDNRNISFVYDPNSGLGSWIPVWLLTVGGTPLSQRAIPIRAQYRAPDFAAVSIIEEDIIPVSLGRSFNYPNPFNRSTHIRYSIIQPTNVTLRIFDVLGREVCQPIDRYHTLGEYQAFIDTAGWASGLYLYILETPHERITRSMLLVR